MLLAQHMQYTGQISRILNEQRIEEQSYEAFAGTIQVNDYLKLLSMITPSYITLESVSLDLDQFRILTIIGVINVDVNEAEFYLSHYLRQLGNSGLFTKVNPYTLISREEIGLTDDGPEAGLAFEMDCNVPVTSQLN